MGEVAAPPRARAEPHACARGPPRETEGIKTRRMTRRGAGEKAAWQRTQHNVRRARIARTFLVVERGKMCGVRRAARCGQAAAAGSG